MAERVLKVTPAQVAAARLRVERDRARGRETDERIVRIANAISAEAVIDTGVDAEAEDVAQQGAVSQGRP